MMLWVFHYQITLQLQDNGISGKVARMAPLSYVCKSLFCLASSLHIDRAWKLFLARGGN